MAPVPDTQPASVATVIGGELRRIARRARIVARERLAVRVWRKGEIDRAWVLTQLRPPSPPPPPDTLEALVVEACNAMFRIGVDHARLSSEDVEIGAAIGRIGVNLRQFGRELRRRQIESRDVAGRPFDPNSSEFEPRGHSPQVGVTAPTILECFRPLITRNGRILQAAVGVVVTPPAATAEET